jgi:hypothetical protein
MTSATPRCSEGRARHDEAEWPWRGMEHGAAADVARPDVGWGRRREVVWGGAWRGEPRRANEELGISVNRRSVDGVDRGESIDGPVGLIAVLERARSRASNFFKIPNVCSDVALPFY